MLSGLLARDITLAGSTSTELIGEGDVLQPWASRREEGLVRYRVAWHVLRPVRLAVLDDELGRSLARWPQVMSTLLERAIRRTHRMSLHAALLQLTPVETRLLVLFWHLAERWGRVSGDGVIVPLALTHRILGQPGHGTDTAPERDGEDHPQMSGVEVGVDRLVVVGHRVILPEPRLCRHGRRVHTRRCGPAPRPAEGIAGFPTPADCTVDVNDGSAIPTSARLTGCTVIASPLPPVSRLT